MKELKKSGFVSVLGRPNVGKSTLVNAIVGEKVSIVSHRPQTTRNRITAVYNREDTQIAFMDTPGLIRPRTRLDEYLGGAVRHAMAGVDVALLVTEPAPEIHSTEIEICKGLASSGTPFIVVINKIDRLPDKAMLFDVIQRYDNAFRPDAVIPVSALKGDGIGELLKALDPYMLPGPQMFPADTLTDQPEIHVICEIMREKLLKFLEHEVPHGTAVEAIKFEAREGTDLIDISLNIVCEKQSHKGIIIGKRGEMLKKMSSLAREDMEKFMGCRVYLECWVKVRENWRDSDAAVRTLCRASVESGE